MVDDYITGKAVILEGPDGGGKSQLASVFSTNYSYAYVHTTAPIEKANIHYSKPLWKFRNKRAVYDRLHVGNYVYGTMFRGGSDLSPLDIWQIEGFLWQLSGIIVYCRPPDRYLDLALSDKKTDFFESNKIKVKAVRLLYEDYFCRPNSLPVIKYDYTKDDPHKIANIVTNYHNQMIKGGRASFIGLGNWHSPDYVLVGDEINKNAWIKRAKQRGFDVDKYLQRVDKLVPKVSGVFNSESGTYLMQALALADLSMFRYVVLDSKYMDGTTINYWDIEPYIGKADIIALGKKAQQRLEKIGISSRYVPHPTHMRRFHYPYSIEYSEMILGKRDPKCCEIK